MTVTVVGAGLAGSEAAWQAARFGERVLLYEMRPEKMTPAHQTAGFAELVCSNSFRGSSLKNAVGLLKEEMKALGSLIMEAAVATQVPAGGALAVDRHEFSRYITRKIEGHPNIEVIRREVRTIPAGPVVIATGPLTSSPLAESIAEFTGEDYLYFYDAAAPIVSADSIDHEVVYRASRYGRGEDYLNCPLSREQYLAFWKALVAAEVHEKKDFDHVPFFEGCLPVEVMARRGEDTLRFGPMKPVGLPDPRTGEIPYAVVQLRPENREGTMYNLVGFQTNLKWPEQKRVFRMIPGLERAEFLRYGVMHRNTFLNGPKVLLPTLQTIRDRRVLFAGQICGVEGYVESAATGFIAGVNLVRLAQGKEPLVFPRETAHGALVHHVSGADPRSFQPMNINFGLFPPPGRRVSRERKREYLSSRALRALRDFASAYGLSIAAI